MRHQNKGKKLDRKKEAREMMLRNLTASIIIYEKVKTTEAKAKAVKSLVEKVITIAKTDNLTSRRRLLAILPQKLAAKKALEVLGKKYSNQQGGYTRIVKMTNRLGDGAKMVQIELI